MVHAGITGFLILSTGTTQETLNTRLQLITHDALGGGKVIIIIISTEKQYKYMAESESLGGWVELQLRDGKSQDPKPLYRHCCTIAANIFF